MNTPEKYIKRTASLNDQYNTVLAEVVKYYPSYKVNPKFTKYEENYNTNLANLQQLGLEYATLKNNLNKDNDTMFANIKTINEQIHKLEAENKKLQAELDLLTNSDNAAGGRLTDASFFYNKQLAMNWLMFTTLVVLGVKYYQS